MRVDVAAHPVAERFVARKREHVFSRPRLGAASEMICGLREAAFDATDFVVRQSRCSVTQVRPLLVDLGAKYIGGHFLDEYLDSRAILVVAAAVAVVDAQYRFEVSQQMLPRDEFAHDRADQRCAPETAACQHAKPDLPALVAQRLNADVMDLNRCPVGFCAAHRNFELARQVSELGMKGRPLANDFAPYEGIDDLVRRDAREMIRRRIAYAIAAGLDRMHLDGCEFFQNVRHLLKLRPVELDVLPRAE